MVLPMDVDVRAERPMPSRVLARVATTGIYLVRGVSRDLQRAARRRAVSEGTTLCSVLVQALTEYAAGNSRPQPDGKLSEPARQRGSPKRSRRGTRGSLGRTYSEPAA